MSATEEEEFQPSERDNHSTVRVGDNLYMWGGYQRSLTYEHESDRKREITSVVEKFNLLTGKWEQKPTTNNPPLGVWGYASACIENEIFYFGGACNHDNCHHNSLHSLDVNTLEWKEVAKTSSTSGPMQKRCGAMLALEFKKGDGGCLAVVGGYGPVSDNVPEQVGAMYGRDEADDSYQYCNEIHYFSQIKRQWLSPTVTGDRLPPISNFTLTPVTTDSAILFGGNTPDGPSNRLYTLKFKESEVGIREIPNPGGSDPWPAERDSHYSVLIDNGSSGPLILVMGGMDMSDCWILDINKRSWKQLDTLEDDITERYDYSMAVYNVTPSISWVVVFGGRQPWSVLRDTNVLEIEYSNDELRVGVVPLDQYESELNKKYIDKWCIEGSVELKLTRVQMLGHPGSGKTCAQHLLLNEDPPYYVPASNPSTNQDLAHNAESSPTTESTPIACKAVKALRISVDDDEGLQRVQSDKLLLKLAADLKNEVEKALADLQEKETEGVDYSLQPQEYRATADEESMAISKNEETADTGSTGISDLRRNEDVRGIEDSSETGQDSSSESPKKKFKASLEESDILENISNLITKAKAAKLSREWVYIIDSGGQPAFQELLPLFTRAASLTVITLNISKDLEDEVTIEYRIKGETFNYDQEPVHTNLEVFKSAVSSGAIYQNPLVSLTDHPNHSMFFVLGTHFDVFEKKYKNKIERRHKIKEMSEKLTSSVPPDLKKDSVIFIKKDSIIYPVNTLLKGAERKKASKELSDAISKRGEVSFTIEVPIRWFALELQLEKKAELRGFVSKEEAIAEGERLKMTGIEVERALKYLHHCTIILYYPEVEPKLVFLKPQVIIDVLSHLLVLTYKEDRLIRLLAGSVTTKEVNDIADYGKFRKTLLEKFDKFTGEFTPRYFINLLNHLHIIAELPIDATTEEQVYFLPCALPPYDASTFEIPASKIKPFRLLWNKNTAASKSIVTVCVPQGSFHLMIVHLLKQKRYTVKLSSQFQQYRNAVMLLVSFSPPRKEKVYIVNRDEYLEITYIGSQEYCPALLELVKVAVKESIAAINVSCGELCTAFACLEDGNCIVDEEGEPIECPDAKGHSSCESFNDDRYLCWFKNSKLQDSVATPTVTSNGDKLPGGTTILNESHKPLILEALKKVVSQWKRIGIQLGIENHELETIEYNRRYQVENQVQDCRKDMVNLWIRTGTATKRRLIEALEAEGLKEDADELKQL
uniref:Death domain-containing protein n=1 Tax=Amphimedon queenslandica TaxID=400682 RepID=A0A1X7U7X2_AMPQE